MVRVVHTQGGTGGTYPGVYIPRVVYTQDGIYPGCTSQTQGNTVGFKPGRPFVYPIVVVSGREELSARAEKGIPNVTLLDKSAEMTLLATIG